MENTEIYYLASVIFVCYGFNLAQGLRAAINRNETVRVVPKILCSIYCISASLIGASLVPYSTNSYVQDFLVHPSMSYLIYFHFFIILFQLAMVWFPKPKE
tara:strand:+ start:340 stop:642 length:303 start_codon:yes stop_codon:yes gene_type:complete